MRNETFEFQIVTPMFLGGADQQAEGIRPASIKGALRFWWRALNWVRCWQLSQPNNEAALRLLHAEEARLFGVAAGWDKDTKKSTGGQGIFLMQVAEVKTQTVPQPFSPMAPGQLYLLGMGLATFKEGGKCLRNALQKGGSFTLKLVFHPQATDKDVRQVKDAVRAFGLLGALGSRARHGLGSVALTGPDAPNTRAEYIQAVRDLLKPTLLASGEAPFTAFSAHTRVDVSAAGNDALRLLDTVGREQQLYRSYGQGGRVNGQPAERNFKEDHHDLLKVFDGKFPSNAPVRSVFGLPHNYYFSSQKDIRPAKGKVDVDYIAPDGKDGRRASPLLLHIHPLSDVGFTALNILMPAQFLPDGKQTQVKLKVSENRYKSHNAPINPAWEKLHEYLNRFIDKEGVTIHGKY
ncbi:MAG: hypothetical protein RLZZ352_2423 [Pseudomonadota bacterium]|jgi:CRISPR-associated protein Cmr1